MKQKPVFKNTTKGRIQVIQQGIPIWMNPGDVIVGERFRVFMKMGLEEVGRDQMPKAARPVTPVAKPQEVAVNDPEPEKAPIKVRELKMVDMVLPSDEIRIAPGAPLPSAPAPEPDPILELEDAEVLTDGLHPEASEAPEEPVEEEEESEVTELEEEVADGEEPVLALNLVQHGDALKDEILADILGDANDEPLVVMDEEDVEDLEDLEEPDDYPFKCDIDDCERAFASKRGLKSHQRSHKTK